MPLLRKHCHKLVRLHATRTFVLSPLMAVTISSLNAPDDDLDVAMLNAYLPSGLMAPCPAISA